MLPPLVPGREGWLRACASGALLAAVLGAGMTLAGTAAGAEQDEPAPPGTTLVQTGPLPPEETAPPPAPTNPPPTTTPNDPPEPQSQTITLTVPAAPAAKPKQVVAKQASASAPAPAAKEESAAPRSAARMRERDRPRRARSYAEPAALKATAKPTRRPARRAKQLPAAVPAPVASRYAVVVRDSTRASAVLGAQFPPQAVAASPPDRGLYLLIALAVVGSLLLGVAGAAPRLAWYWPEIFVPIARAREGLSFFGASLIVCGVVAWAIVAPVA